MAKLSQAEYEAIVAFITPQLRAQEKHVEAMHPLIHRWTDSNTRANYDYARNYCSACRQLLGIARQKLKDIPNVT